MHDLLASCVEHMDAAVELIRRMQDDENGRIEDVMAQVVQCLEQATTKARAAQGYIRRVGE